MEYTRNILVLGDQASEIVRAMAGHLQDTNLILIPPESNEFEKWTSPTRIQYNAPASIIYELKNSTFHEPKRKPKKPVWRKGKLRHI
jgi:hypothetical protein